MFNQSHNILLQAFVVNGDLPDREGTYTRNIVWTEALKPTAMKATTRNVVGVPPTHIPPVALPPITTVNSTVPKPTTTNVPATKTVVSGDLSDSTRTVIRREALKAAPKKFATRNVVGGVMPLAPNDQPIGPVLWQCDENTLSREMLRVELDRLITHDTWALEDHERMIIVSTANQADATFQHSFIKNMLERDQFLEFDFIDNLARMIARRHGVTTYDRALPQLFKQLLDTEFGGANFSKADAEVIIKNSALQLLMYMEGTVVVHKGDGNYGHFLVIKFDNITRQVDAYDSCGTRLGMATAGTIA
jgi:hypothetical protein